MDLPGEAAHHAVRVLRLREGDAVTLFNFGDVQMTFSVYGAVWCVWPANALKNASPIGGKSPSRLANSPVAIMCRKTVRFLI